MHFWPFNTKSEEDSIWGHLTDTTQKVFRSNGEGKFG